MTDSNLSNNLSLFRYREEAMATHFEFWICCSDKNTADSAASMAFRELDRLESLLSRFQDGSDIVRINSMQTGERLLISPECHECIQQALEIQLITQGRFDPATGGYMQLLRDLEGNPVKASESDWDLAKLRRQEGQLQLDPSESRISCTQAGLQLDLGGIGKGYALEQISELFQEMELTNFLLSAGGSTLLSRGTNSQGNPWGTRLAGASATMDVLLENACLSGSGFEVKGAHIVSNGKPMESAPWKRVWVRGPHGALVDGLSTACFQMSVFEIAAIIESLNGEIDVWCEELSGKIEKIVYRCEA